MVSVTNVMNRVRVNEKFEFYQKTSSTVLHLKMVHSKISGVIKEH